ncbi:MAG: hypothetical protein Q8K59_02435 [Nitrosomonas sp.]|nr:hypothetical protein [Nitrosomonas sp.]MDP1949950.1 hypothetical protein [Nitrosomonas sp.]
MDQIKRIGTSIIAFAVLVTLAGCTSFGSSILTEERINYNVALQITNDEQLLLNLVRLRYLDSTAFIEVSSITAQSSFQSSLQGGRVPLPSIAPMFGFTGNLGYSTQPTLVYIPLQGEDFIRRLMSPLTLERLVLLYHSGWDIKRLFSLCLNEINEIHNIRGVPHPDSAPSREIQKFARIVELLGKLDARSGLDLLMETQPESATPQYFLRILLNVLETSEAQSLAQLLDLQPNQTYYRLAYPSIQTEKAPSRDTISVQPRSLLGIMSFLSQWVDMPTHDQENGRMDEGSPYETSQSPDGGKSPDFPFSIKSQSERPNQAAVAVRYRNNWFFIDDADLGSKGTFSLLTQIFALQASAISVTPPVLTLPIGQ